MYRDQEQRDFARELRNNPQDAERRLWHYLRAEKLGVKFRHQVAIGAYVVDFVCLSRKLIIELDGRSIWMRPRGITMTEGPLG